MFDTFSLSASGKQPAQVVGGGRDDDDDVGLPSDSWTEAGSASAVSPIRYGKCVALVNDLGALCCGRIGTTGSIFCGELSSKGCPPSHGNKVSVLEARKATGTAALYYMTKSATKIKLSVDPMLDTADLDTMVVEGLLQANFENHGEWVHEVQSRNEAVLRGVAISVARSTVKKPVKFNLMDEDDDDSAVDATLQLSDLFQGAALNSPLREDTRKPAPAKPDVGNIGSISSDDEGWMSKVDKHIGALMSTGDQALKDKIGKLSTDIQLIRAEVGTPGMHFARAGLSIWEAVENSRAPDLMKWLKDPSTRKDLQEAVFSSPPFVKYLKDTKDTFDSFIQRFDQLELAHANPTSTASSGTSMFDTFRIGGKPVSTPTPAHEDTLAKLTQKVADLERAKNGSASRGEITVVFKDRVFTSLRDVRAVFRMCTTSTTLVRPSLVHDAYTIFDLVADRVFGYPDERKIAPDKAQRLNRSIKDLQHIQSSTLSGLPNFFDGSKSSKMFMDGSIKGSKTSVFSNIKSHEMWGPIGTPHNCVREASERALDSIKLEYLSNPKDGVDPAVAVLLDAMLVRSVEFVKAVFSFLTKEYETLKLYFSDGDKCWNFLCNCVKQVFSSEFHVARTVSSSADHQDLDGTNEKVIWTALRTISIQEDFLRVGFANHSGLSSAYSRFMLTHMPNKTVTKLQLEMDSTMKKLKAMEEKVTKVEGLANSAISKAAAAAGGKKKKDT